MKELETWMLRRAAKDQRIPLIEDVLLSGTFGQYAFYRLRLFLLRSLVSTVAHTARLTLLWAAFSRGEFVQLLLFEAGVGLASSFWWGALESMRDRIRRLHRHGRTHLVRPLIERWLALAIVVGAVIMTGGVVWLMTRPAPFAPADLYGLALFVRLALQIVTRTYHSGLYALRRIYRPAWSIVAVEIVMLGAVAAAWPMVGAWALPLGLIVAAVIGTGLTIHFTRRAFVFFGVTPRWTAFGTLRGRWHVPWLELMTAGLSFAIVKLDAMLVFLLFDRTPALEGGVELFMLFFVMSPAIQAGVDWAQLFYFDLKRLEHEALSPLVDRYRRYLVRVAWILGVASWGLASLTGTIVYLRDLGVLYWLLLPFFLSRSMAASAQIHAFCSRRYGPLLATALLWLGVFALVTRVDSEAGKLAIVTTASVAVAIVLTRLKPAGAAVRERFLGVAEWLHLLSTIEGPVRVGSATVRRTRRKRQGRETAQNAGGAERLFARRVATQLARGGAVTCLPENRLVWFEPAGATRLQAEAMAVLSGGLAQSARDAIEYASGREALRAAWRDHGLGALFGRGDFAHDGTLSIGELENRFARWFPDGRVLTPGSLAPSTDTLPAPWRRRVLGDAMRFLARLEAPRTGSPVDVTAICLGGRLHRLFVVPRTSRLETRRRWRTVVRRANVLAALGAVAD